MQSVEEHPDVAGRYIEKEVWLGRVLGPLKVGGFPHININHFGVIPKTHQPGEWHLIVDLSHPAGASVNDGIEPELRSLRYPSVDETVRRLLARTPTHSW